MRMRLLVLSVGMLAGLTACGGSQAATLEFVEILPAQPRIGDVVTVRFRLADDRGVPLAGAPVDYKLGSMNTGVTLTPPSSVSIKGSGFAETQVVASGRVNSVVVIATSGTKSVSSPPITFAGSVVPSASQFTFQCGPIAGEGSGGRHAIGAYDESRHLIAGVRLDCSARLGDRNGDAISDALVSFVTEAGTITPSAVTAGGELVGAATVTFSTSLPLPVDVTPGLFSWTPDQGDNFTGDYIAPLWMMPYIWREDPRQPVVAGMTFNMREPRRPDPIRFKADGSGRYENNPRDNLVSMIAVTSGEEGFTDTNNNGQFDEGEAFEDLTEPFVDSNDNGTWDDFEKFIDVNGNRTWNGKNGKWDANTLIWRSEKILWTGIPADEDVLDFPSLVGHRKVFTPVSPANLQFVCPGAGACSQAGDPVNFKPIDVRGYIADPWFNTIARNGDSDSCEIPQGDESPVKVKFSNIAGFAFTYPPGEPLYFTIADARDPNLPAVDQIPKRIPAIGFRNTIICTWTASPKDGYVTKYGAGTIEGTIE